MDILIRKWNNFLNITPLGLIQLHGYSPLNNGSKSSFLHSNSSQFDQKLAELAICQNKLKMDILIRKWNNFFNITPLGFFKIHGYSPLNNSSKSRFLHIYSSCFDQKFQQLAICPNRQNMDIMIRKWNNFLNITHLGFI